MLSGTTVVLQEKIARVFVASKDVATLFVYEIFLHTSPWIAVSTVVYAVYITDRRCRQNDARIDRARRAYCTCSTVPSFSTSRCRPGGGLPALELQGSLVCEKGGNSAHHDGTLKSPEDVIVKPCPFDD